jgi:hypothetical protein
MKSLSVSVALVALLATACGHKPPKTADDTTTSTTPPAAEDMPPATGTPTTATPGDTKPAEPTATPAAPPAIKVVALRLVLPPKDAKKLGLKALEVKDDGTVTSDGKPVMKVVGAELQDIDHGSTIFAVTADGSVNSSSGNAVGKFAANDDLVLATGAKLVITDDGFLQMTDDKGKMNVLGPKFESAPAWSKREAALVGFSLVGASGQGDMMAAPLQKQTATPTAAKPAGKGGKPKKK